MAALLADCAPGSAITPDALEYMQAMPWPGNIRELRSMLARLSIAASNCEIDLAAVMRASGSTANGVGARVTTIFREEDGNVSHTARRLGVSRNTIYRAIRDSDRGK